ncbi:MAG: bifunctional phosphopantothenoylcysteine decarboxylase/phosphopantothenate--cysteine ligase CoaBC [Fusobacterium sp.]|nr:bifunctional phosphopantothenoylcysteine decarboxylase/phosphopantothenate--cysteine ligase CoaBC [Fusobacterium sp.]
MCNLSGKTILIGITGGIAAYKICELIRIFKRSGANVKVIVTPNALNFVTKLTLQNLSQNDVAVEEFEIADYKPEHISLADEADIFVIAPATANTISKLAHGICDNLLTSVACAYRKRIILAPAMNCNMWENPIIQENLAKLNCKILEPESGFLACGYEGKGRLCSLEKIYDATVEELFANQPLKGKKILITAGGTIEDIDPVRYISNYSSGKMGFALAKVARDLGAEVTLISTVPHSSAIMVKSALEMQSEILKHIETQDAVFMAAAVADFRVKNSAEQKIKKVDGADEITLTLVKNPDILKTIYDLKPNAKIIGFCAESENLLANAKDKIQRKGCDYLIANDISRKDIGFGADENEVHILSADGKIEKIEKASKEIIAKEIFKRIWSINMN